MIPESCEASLCDQDSSSRKGRGTVELGAVIVVPGGENFATVAENPRPLYSSRMPILGNDVLHSWTERVRKLGIQSLWLTSASPDNNNEAESPVWSGLRRFVRQGVERFLMITLKSYAEMDLADLVRFHCENHNLVTEARDGRRQLGVCLLDHSVLNANLGEAKDEKHKFPGADGAGRVPYQFRGYAKRILSAKERQELVGDALTGACAMRPFGKQIREQVWIGEGVNLADSARVTGPTYIGERTVVRAGATIGPFASVERDCVVDCGTTVERSTVLPSTYLAPGLLIRNGLVDGRYLEDLAGGAVVDLQPAGLGSRIERPESRRQAVRDTHVSLYDSPRRSARADATLTWDFASSSTATQPWLRVQL
jgi:carbonic anhydrase/acetyltransferase-like protein (isoleucine patch superfamily)